MKDSVCGTWLMSVGGGLMQSSSLERCDLNNQRLAPRPPPPPFPQASWAASVDSQHITSLRYPQSSQGSFVKPQKPFFPLLEISCFHEKLQHSRIVPGGPLCTCSNTWVLNLMFFKVSEISECFGRFLFYKNFLRTSNFQNESALM